jgi:signal transduction histidine kinase
MNAAPASKILIVDDEPNLVDALTQLLLAQGFSTAGAASGVQALGELRAAKGGAVPFDVLITDLKMPAMDGIALVEAAHRIDADLVSIVMTGHGTIDTAVAAMKAGALDYILKPFSLRIAMPVLSRALAVRKLRLDNARLLEQVANRTSELEAANRELRSVNKELDSFGHSLSHDVRQPLNVMIGFTDLLMSEKPGSLNPKQREFLGDIRDGGRYLMRLTEDLLKFSRLSQVPVQKQAVNMETLVWEILRANQAAEPERRMDLRVGPLPGAFADPTLLRQVMVNLIANAFKFTRRVSHPLIEITGESRTGETSYCISDNGAGFDMADAARLFSIFQRLHSEAAFEGTGVGLSIVKRIVERHGGTISAEAQLGKGATFLVTLPS